MYPGEQRSRALRNHLNRRRYEMAEIRVLDPRGQARRIRGPDQDMLAKLRRQRMLGDRLIIGHQHGPRAAARGPSGQRSFPINSRLENVAPRPESAISWKQVGRLGQHRLANQRSRRQPIEMRRGQPRIAIRAQVSRTEPIDDKDNRASHAPIVARARSGGFQPPRGSGMLLLR
jgi:hypothetical protein